MTRKTLTTLVILGVLLVSMFGTVAAQTGTDPDPVEDPETVTITHPVVKLLGAYFGRSTGEVTEPDPLEDPLEDPADPEDPAEPEVTPESVAEEIAAYHEQGMGFGVLVKLYAMAEASREACAAEAEATAEGEAEECTPLLVDDLVTEFKSGAGMGKMFKEYGKPALLGVGHVKKALKAHEQEQEEVVDDEEVLDDEEALEKGKKNKGNKQPKENKGKKDK